MKHLFLFSEQDWIGQGKISFSASPDVIKFYTSWKISSPLFNEWKCIQNVEMLDSHEKVENVFRVTEVEEEKFHITLSNGLIGNVEGKGIVTDKKVAWEFLGHPHFEGFEVYELQEGGDYLFHAEYLSADQFRSIIDGRIWKKT